MKLMWSAELVVELWKVMESEEQIIWVQKMKGVQQHVVWVRVQEVTALCLGMGYPVREHGETLRRVCCGFLITDYLKIRNKVPVWHGCWKDLCLLLPEFRGVV